MLFHQSRYPVLSPQPLTLICPIELLIHVLSLVIFVLDVGCIFFSTCLSVQQVCEGGENRGWEEEGEGEKGGERVRGVGEGRRRKGERSVSMKQYRTLTFFLGFKKVNAINLKTMSCALCPACVLLFQGFDEQDVVCLLSPISIFQISNPHHHRQQQSIDLSQKRESSASV